MRVCVCVCVRASVHLCLCMCARMHACIVLCVCACACVRVHTLIIVWSQIYESSSYQKVFSEHACQDTYMSAWVCSFVLDSQSVRVMCVFACVCVRALVWALMCMFGCVFVLLV